MCSELDRDLLAYWGNQKMEPFLGESKSFLRDQRFELNNDQKLFRLRKKREGILSKKHQQRKDI